MGRHEVRHRLVALRRLRGNRRHGRRKHRCRRGETRRSRSAGQSTLQKQAGLAAFARHGGRCAGQFPGGPLHLRHGTPGLGRTAHAGHGRAARLLLQHRGQANGLPRWRRDRGSRRQNLLVSRQRTAVARLGERESHPCAPRRSSRHGECRRPCGFAQDAQGATAFRRPDFAFGGGLGHGR